MLSVSAGAYFYSKKWRALSILITVADTCSRTLTAINTAAPTNNLGDDAFTGGRVFDGLSDTRVDRCRYSGFLRVSGISSSRRPAVVVVTDRWAPLFFSPSGGGCRYRPAGSGTRVIEHYSDAIAVPIFILDPL